LIEIAETDFDRWKDADYKSTAGFTLIEKIADDILAKWSAFLKNEDENGNGNGNGNSSENNDEKEKQNGSSNQGSNEESNGESSSSDDNEENNDESSNQGSNEDSNDESSDDNEENNAENNKSSSSKSNSSSDNSETENSKNNSSDDNENSKNNSSDDNSETENSNNGSGANDTSSSIDKKYYDDDEVGIEKELKEKMEEIIKESQKEFGEYRAFTDDDCVLKAEEKQSYYEQAKSRVAGAISMFSGYLEQSLRSMSRCRKIGNRDRGILDVRALPAFAKNLTKNVFYTQKQGISLDTTVSILIDESGSMYESGKYLTCRSVAIALAEVLNRLDIKFEILGHTTGSSSCNNAHLFNRSASMMIFEHKNFNESYAREKYRLGSIDQYNCNIDSEALLYTFKRAMEQRSNRHIIMVLSDGMPSGTRNREVGYKHLKKVVNFCRKNGAEVYAFGIQAEEPKDFYGDDYFVYLKNMNDFNTTFFRKVANIISKGKM
jgi:cobalamin biosynthesis protein CobT